jgi:hypothetical protein
MDKELNNLLTALLEYQEAAKRENIDEDSMETILLDTLESAGIHLVDNFY